MNLIDELPLIQIAGRRLHFMPEIFPKLGENETLVLHARQPFGNEVAIVDEKKYAVIADELARKMWTSVDAYAVPSHLLPVPGTLVADAAEVGRLVDRAARRTVPTTPAELEAMWHGDRIGTERLRAENAASRGL